MNLTTAAAGNPASIAPEFVIGVTGHRDPAATGLEPLRSAISAELKGLRARFSATPLRLVSGLAEGADTVAAEVALEQGIPVSAVLPMPLAQYEADFEGAALDKLRALIANDKVKLIELPLVEGASPGTVSEPARRDLQYAALRDYIIRRSNMLLAVWDGTVNGLPGGTSDVVMGYLGGFGGDAPMAVDTPPGTDGNEIVCWIPVRRESAPDVTPPAARSYLVSNANRDCYWRSDSIPAQIVTRWQGLDDYARDRMAGVGENLPAYPLVDTPDACGPEAAALNAEFIRADQMAVANQSQSDRMFRLFGLMAAAMGFLFLVYAKLLAVKTLLVLYIALFGLGYIAFKVSAKRHWLGKHLAYRALAETYRVQFFLLLSGAGEGYDLRRILSLTSVDRFSRFEWLQDAVRCAEPATYHRGLAAEDGITLGRRAWIEDQAAYFHRKHRAMHQQHQTLERVKAALLIGSVIGALALIFFKEALHHMEMGGFDGKAWLVFLMGLLPLWVAVWELYQGKMATRELIWQYANQGEAFGAAAMQLEHAASAGAARRIIRDLADKALIEIYLWSVHRYHREHEPPAAG